MLRGGLIQDTIVGEVAIPTYFTLFGGEALPSKGGRQGSKRFLLSAFFGPFVSGAMYSPIDALAPDMGLTIEIIDICEGDSCPEALFDKAYRPLDFAFCLRRICLADPWSYPNRGHEIGKEWVPPRLLVFHLQEHTFHPVGEGGLRQPSEVLK